MKPLDEKDLALIQEIEKKIFSQLQAGIDLTELNILDDVNVSKRAIQDLGVKVSVNDPELAVTILEIAHSVYFGRNLQGAVPDFFDAVIRLGGDRTKLLIFSLSLFSLEKGPAGRLRAARSAGISVLAGIIAESMNLRDDLIRKVESGGLLSQLGKSIFMKVRELGMNLSDEFIEKYHIVMAQNVIDRLKLDPVLKKIIDLSIVEFDEESFSLAGIVKLAEVMIEDSFRRYGKLIVRSPMPDRHNIVTQSPGSTIKKLFSTLGVEDFLEVQEYQTGRQLESMKIGTKKHPGK